MTAMSPRECDQDYYTEKEAKEAAYLHVLCLLDNLAHGTSPVPMFLVKEPRSGKIHAFPPERFEEVFRELRDILQRRIKDEGLCPAWEQLKEENKKLWRRVWELEKDLGYRRRVVNRLAGEDLWKNDGNDGR